MQQPVMRSSPNHHRCQMYQPLMPLSIMTPLEEITLKKCQCGSSPNPLDGIPYTILKRCPSLHPALLHLYNTCLMTKLCSHYMEEGCHQTHLQIQCTVIPL